MFQLTLRPPEKSDDLEVDAEDDGADDDGRQGGLWDEGAVRHHHGQGKENN